MKAAADQEVRRLLDRPSWPARRVAVWAAIVAVLLLAPLVVTNGYHLTLATNVIVTMILTFSLNFVIGRIGLFSLSHAAFLGVGGYVAAILAQRHGVEPWLTLPLAMAASMAIAGLIGVPVLRLRGFFLAVATLAFTLFADVFARQATDITGGAYGITNIPPLTLFGLPLRGPWMYEVAVLALLLSALVLENVRLSRLGRAILAARDNEAAAAAAGIDIPRTQLAGYVLSAAITGLAGWVYSFFHLTLNPFVLSLDITFLWLFIVLVGGLGSMRGAALASILLGVGPEMLGFAAAQQVLTAGVLVLLVVLLFPRGLGGLVEDIEARWRRRPATGDG
ncbi:MAG: branched-chain amino acid ABC transporter permease [Alphaproteobacteria bacterium]|nr:branched-chain amino acid ABC transporter permease [Alphaproteobacteria bacterium]